jgi:hypothetical protein
MKRTPSMVTTIQNDSRSAVAARHFSVRVAGAQTEEAGAVQRTPAGPRVTNPDSYKYNK